MWAFIRGQIVVKALNQIVVEAGGIGYEIAITNTTYSQIGEIGETVQIPTQLIIREDNWQIYGFANAEEKQLFNAVTKVSGIGPKIAMGILSSTTTGELVSAIQNQNVAMLEKIPGIGRKTAQRLLVDLADNIKKIQINIADTADNHIYEVESALLALGFKQNDVTKAMRLIDTSHDTSTMLRNALHVLKK